MRRFLKQIGYYRSYNDNGKWYTLHTIPRFDAYGIWLYEQIAFSREGSLTATILSLVRKSLLGLSAAELSAILHRRSHAVLTMMHKSGRVERVKCGPEFRYLCADQTINARQRRALRPRLSESPAEPLREEAAVFVLVAYIKDSALSFAEVARLLRQEKQIRLSARTIAGFFARQGIKKNDRSSGAKLSGVLESCLQRLLDRHSALFLFPSPPVLYFTAEQVRCDRCEGPLRVLKTRRKTVYSLPLGPFQAHETLLHCGRCADPTAPTLPGSWPPSSRSLRP